MHQTLLQTAKRAGSLDNITVIVVFLTSPIEIASRPLNAHPLLYSAPNGLLNNMDPNNPFLSNVNGQFDVNAAFVKQQLDADLQRENNTGLVDDNRVIYGTTSSNGKHEEEDADGNEDYDYGDLGPETNVDAIDDALDVRTNLDKVSCELFPEKSRLESSTEAKNDDEDDDDDDGEDRGHDNANNVRPPDDGTMMDNRIREQSDENVCGADDGVPRDNDHAPRAVDSDVGTARIFEPVGFVDDLESRPPSKCNLSSVRTRLCAALVYGYVYHAVSNLFVSLANYISSSFGAYIFGRK